MNYFILLNKILIKNEVMKSNPDVDPEKMSKLSIENYNKNKDKWGKELNKILKGE